jgi:hypothetical protein
MEKSFGIHITNVAPGDFATNIVLPVVIMHLLQASAYEVSYGESLRTMDEHVDGVVIQMKWLKLFYKIIQTKEPKALYKVLCSNFRLY